MQSASSTPHDVVSQPTGTITQHSGTTTRFSTILAARSNHGRPSDLEFLLRSHCQKMRVVQTLHGGAHLLIPKLGSSPSPTGGRPGGVSSTTTTTTTTTASLALRIYHECDLSTKTDTTNNVDAHDSDDSNLTGFFQSYQLAVAFLVLPTPRIQQEQLDNRSSLFHRAQRVMRAVQYSVVDHTSSTTTTTTATTTTTTPTRASSSSHTTLNNADKTPRVFLVPTPEAALATLFSMVDALQKREIRQAYFQAQQVKYWLLPPSLPLTTAASLLVVHQAHREEEQCRRHAAAIHIAEALRAWGDRFELPQGEVNVLMSVLTTLGHIVNATPVDLEGIPIDHRTKRLLLAFFGSVTANTTTTTTTASTTNGRSAGNTSSVESSYSQRQQQQQQQQHSYLHHPEHHGNNRDLGNGGSDVHPMVTMMHHHHQQQQQQQQPQVLYPPFVGTVTDATAAESSCLTPQRQDDSSIPPFYHDNTNGARVADGGLPSFLTRTAPPLPAVPGASRRNPYSS